MPTIRVPTIRNARALARIALIGCAAVAGGCALEVASEPPSLHRDDRFDTQSTPPGAPGPIRPGSLPGGGFPPAPSGPPSSAEDLLNAAFRSAYPAGAPSGDVSGNIDASLVLGGPSSASGPRAQAELGAQTFVGVQYAGAASPVDAICVGFGSAASAWCIPRSSAGLITSGDATTGAIVAPVTFPPSVCGMLSSICHDIRCYEFARTAAGTFSRANINLLAMACGNCDEPSCQSLLTMCEEPGTGCGGTATAMGSDTPVTRTIELGASSGTFVFSYDTFTQQDRITVSYEGATIFDTGCVGAQASVPLTISGTSTSVTVSVEPNCASPGATGTQWEFSVGCPT